MLFLHQSVSEHHHTCSHMGQLVVSIIRQLQPLRLELHLELEMLLLVLPLLMTSVYMEELYRVWQSLQKVSSIPQPQQ